MSASKLFCDSRDVRNSIRRSTDRRSTRSTCSRLLVVDLLLLINADLTTHDQS